MKTPIVVGDIGGTHSRLGLILNGQLQTASIQRLRNSDHASFYDLLAHYFHDNQIKTCEQACFAVAAPISGKGVELTNRDWQIDCDQIEQRLNIGHCDLVNDFEALAWSLHVLTRSDLKHVSGPELPSTDQTVSQGLKLVVGAGTGFNAATANPGASNGNIVVNAAECGHMTLPVTTEQELHLWQFLAEGRGRASVERALSGQGLIDIHQWLSDFPQRTQTGLTTWNIVEQATHDPDGIAAKAIDILAGLFGRVAGDLALAYLPKGGIYLNGGMTRALAPVLCSPTFSRAFCAKGRQRELLSSFSIQLINVDHAALLGCMAMLQTKAATQAFFSQPQPVSISQ